MARVVLAPPEVTPVQALGILEERGARGATAGEIARALGTSREKVARALAKLHFPLERRQITTEWVPRKDHPYAVQELRYYKLAVVSQPAAAP